MKSTAKAVASFALSFTLFGAVLAHGQSAPGQFQHVIIVVQENRTPDNLFGGSLAGYPQNFPTLGTGTDLAIDSTDSAIEWCLGACFDPDHGNNAWQAQYNSGSYNACPAGQAVSTQRCPNSTCNGHTVCAHGNSCGAYQVPSCPQETYVSLTYDNNSQDFGPAPPVLPYFDIAHKYGFANYFLQTNQGPSQPAHDFLFGGTSAPAGASTDPYGAYLVDFAADNPEPGALPTGCGYTSGQTVNIVDPSADIITSLPPCFEHRTLSDLLEANNLTWKYYTTDARNIWTAPNGIQHICGSVDANGNCLNSDFTNHVATPTQAFLGDFPLGTNLPNGNSHGMCQVPNVTWIVPNGFFSDHPGFSGAGEDSTTREFGPDWVAAVINAVGSATCYDEKGQEPWQDTVVFVVWDDWGGFYDHVGPELPLNGAGTQWYPNCYFQSGWGCGYTYGWRVPFLVVSAYTPDGYVSGACGASGLPTCPAPSPYYVHDFGSILGFIENNFGLGMGSINSVGNGGSGYLFADNYYPEYRAEDGPYLPLGDFFGLWPSSENYTGNPGPKAFESIQVAGPYGFSYFQNYNGPVEDPDNDVIDNN